MSKAIKRKIYLLKQWAFIKLGIVSPSLWMVSPEYHERFRRLNPERYNEIAVGYLSTVKEIHETYDEEFAHG